MFTSDYFLQTSFSLDTDKGQDAVAGASKILTLSEMDLALVPSQTTQKRKEKEGLLRTFWDTFYGYF